MSSKKSLSAKRKTVVSHNLSRMIQFAEAFPEEQIVAIIQEYAAGAKVSELCRKYGMSDASFYKWKARYGGLQVSEVRRLKDLEEENRRLKSAVADLTIDNQILKSGNINRPHAPTRSIYDWQRK